MKVYEIAEETTVGTTTVKSGPLKGYIFDPLKDGRIKITAPDGTSMTAANREAAQKKAEKFARTNKPDTTVKKKEPVKKAKIKQPDLTAEKRTKKAKGLFEKIKAAVPAKWTDWFKRHLGRIFGATITGWIMKGIAISGIVSLYNSYFDEIYTLVEAKEKGAKPDELKAIAKNLGTIRKQLIKETTDLMIGSIGMAFGTGSVLVLGVLGGAALTAVTGGAAAPVSFVINMFVGAIAAYGAYEGTLMICKMDYVGGILGLPTNIYDYTQNKLGTTWLTPDNLTETLKEVGADQDFITYILGLTTNPLMQYSSPFAIPGVNSGVSIGGAAKGAIDTVKGIVDHKDHSELDRIMELSGVVQEKKSTKMKIDDLPDDLKKLVMLGAKTIQKANKENKST